MTTLKTVLVAAPGLLFAPAGAAQGVAQVGPSRRITWCCRPTAAEKLPLSVESNTRSSLPGGTGMLTFGKAADGSMTYEFQRTKPPLLKATRK